MKLCGVSSNCFTSSGVGCFPLGLSKGWDFLLKK